MPLAGVGALAAVGLDQTVWPRADLVKSRTSVPAGPNLEGVLGHSAVGLGPSCQASPRCEASGDTCGTQAQAIAEPSQGCRATSTPLGIWVLAVAWRRQVEETLATLVGNSTLAVIGPIWGVGLQGHNLGAGFWWPPG